jgi:hypothetical protein
MFDDVFFYHCGNWQLLPHSRGKNSCPPQLHYMTAEDCAVVYRQTYTRKVDDGKEGTVQQK